MIESNVTIIEPRNGWLAGFDLKELVRYRELLYFLVWRDIKVRYKQTILGAAWAILQPFFTMVVFTIFFGKMAGMPSDGIPYPIFSFAALLPWTYFANAISQSGNSLVNSSNLITKVYFPRLCIPMGATFAGLADFFIALIVLAGMMVWYRFIPGFGLILFPFLVLLTFLLATSVGLWLSALNVKYRDIRYVIPFMVQLWLFITPVIYPTTIAKNYSWILYLNPMAGIIESFRACILGHKPIPWPQLGLSAILTIFMFVAGLAYFNSMEREFADVV
jgi:lipopolysaccharide transport system permease protein